MGKRKVSFVSDYLGSLTARRVRTLGSRVGLVDLDEPMRSIIRTAEPYTLTSGDRVAALCTSVDYIVDHGIPGAFVECGVWRGGSLMAILLRLRQRGISDRDVVGFDTFVGHTKPTREDVDYEGKAEGRIVKRLGKEIDITHFDEVSRDQVFAVLASTGYPPERIHLVAGPVEDTLPSHAPETIALLRLDTDYYVSTRHELEHLYPRIPIGGVLIIDDYGHFKGARKAVDEYLKGHRILLQRVDYSCRLAIKQQER
jgi:O-methyltransferase